MSIRLNAETDGHCRYGAQLRRRAEYGRAVSQYEYGRYICSHGTTPLHPNRS